MTGELSRIPSADPPNPLAQVPAMISDAGDHAFFAWDEFFAIENPNTKAAYESAVMRFLDWCNTRHLQLRDIMPGHVSEYEKTLLNLRTGGPASRETRKLHLSAIRGFFDVLVTRHVIVLNPAKSVRGAKVSSTMGKTPPIPEAAVPVLLNSIQTDNPVGLRDRAIIGVLLYTAVRRGAVAKLQLKSFWTDGVQHYLRFEEKGSKTRDIPVRHDLQMWIEEYIAAAGISDDDPSNPLFRRARQRSGRLEVGGLSSPAISKLVKRRFKAAGLPATLVAHSFRATTITNLLKQNVPLEAVQDLAGHVDARTTRGYDHSSREIRRNIVERIAFE